MRKLSRKLAFALTIVVLALPGFDLSSVRSSAIAADAETKEYDDGLIDKDTVWSGEVKVNGYVMITDGAVLTIRPGTKVSLGHIYVADGAIQARGEAGNRIVFSKNPIDVSGYSEEYDPRCFIRQDGMIEFGGTAERDDPASVLENVVFDGLGTDADYRIDDCPSVCFLDKPSKATFFKIAYAKTISEHNAAVGYSGGKVEIRKADFKNSGYLDVTAEVYIDRSKENYDYLEISDSNFEGNSRQAALEAEAGGYSDDDEYFNDRSVIRLENDWYGDASGPSGEGLSGRGESLSGDYTLDGWSDHRFKDVCADCASNVLFLPGIEASRLYRKSASGKEDRLWLPTPLSDDVEQLRLDADGKGEEGIYAKDVIDKAYGLASSIYASFLDDLDKLESEEKINGYEAFAYDWRQSVEDVVENGTPYPDGERKYPVAETDALAAASKSGKVTIIAHSNGGLLAKALMIELEKEGKADEVDRIVFVGTPQLGTPLSIATLLHGYDGNIAKGLIVSDAEARTLSANMPGAYGLLPSEEYFARAEDRPISFRSGKFHEAYGDGIGDYEKFLRFLTAKDDKRQEPKEKELDAAAVLNEKLLKAAEEEHERLDDWTPPAGVKLIQIAGWGADTVSGLEYGEKEETECIPGGELIPVCYGNGNFRTIADPEFTVDGDGTVVAPSALMMGKDKDIERYWFDLRDNNKWLRKNRYHKDLLEADSLREFLSEIISNDYDNDDLPKYVVNERPDDYADAKPRIRMSLYSPLDIHLYDSQGNHTGPVTETIDGQEVTVIEEGIPNSYYLQLGERKYVGVPAGEEIRVELDGYDSGSYALKMEETDGKTASATLAFADLPTSASTQAALEIPASGLSGVSGLTADYDGDGTADYSVTAVLGGTADLVERLDGKEAVSNSESADDSDDDEEEKNDNSDDSKPEEGKNKNSAIAFLAKGMDSGGSVDRNGKSLGAYQANDEEKDDYRSEVGTDEGKRTFAKNRSWRSVLWMLAIGMIASLLIMLRDIMIKMKNK